MTLLFKHEFNGPVSPELWNDYKEYGWNEIEQLKPNDEKFNKNILELLECCLNYLWGDKSGYELEAISHSEEPWLKARNGLSEFEISTKIIDPADMKTYYKSIYSGD